MKTQLINSDYIECKVDDGKIVAVKTDKYGNQQTNLLKVSKEQNNVYNPVCLPLSNGGFIIFWLQGINNENEILSRRYTAQGLAGKIVTFPIINLAKKTDLDISLVNDFFIKIVWLTKENKIYTKVFNQEGISNEEEKYVGIKANEENDINITYEVIDKDVTLKKTVDKKTPNIINIEKINTEDVTLTRSNIPETPRTKMASLPTLTKKQLPPIKNNINFSLSGNRARLNNRFKMF